MKNIELSKCRSASYYLRKRNDLAVFGSGGFNLGTINKIKSDLVENHEMKEIRSIKIGINSQVELYKQINIIVPVLVFIITMAFTLSNSYTGFALKAIDFANTDKSNVAEVMNAYNKAVKGAFDSNSNSLVFVTAIVTVFLTLYLLRYRWVTFLNNIVNEAMEEKEEKLKEGQ